jgi:hypothetical protein
MLASLELHVGDFAAPLAHATPRQAGASFISAHQELPPKNLLASFFLKFLKHEGLFLWTPTPPPPFNKEEWLVTGQLASSRLFEEIEALPTTNPILVKINDLLNKNISNN